MSLPSFSKAVGRALIQSCNAATQTYSISGVNSTSPNSATARCYAQDSVGKNTRLQSAVLPSSTPCCGCYTFPSVSLTSYSPPLNACRHGQKSFVGAAVKGGGVRRQRAALMEVLRRRIHCSAAWRWPIDRSEMTQSDFADLGESFIEIPVQNGVQAEPTSSDDEEEEDPDDRKEFFKRLSYMPTDYSVLTGEGDTRLTLTELKQRLTQDGVPVREIQRQYLATACPVCQAGTSEATDTQLYGRLDVFASYVCVRCGAMAEDFGKETVEPGPSEDVSTVWKSGVSWNMLSDSRKKRYGNVLKRLWKCPKLSESSFDVLLTNSNDIRFSLSGDLSVVFPRYRIIPGRKRSSPALSSVKVLKWDATDETVTENVLPELPIGRYLPGFFGGDSVSDMEGAVYVTATEVDALVLKWCSRDAALPVVTLPDARNLDKHSQACLSEFRFITLWYPRDIDCRRIAHRLDGSRTKIVNYQASPSKLFADSLPGNLIKERLLGIKFTGTVRDDQKCITVADRKSEVIKNASQRKQHLMGIAQWTRFGVLNRFLGGFRPGEITILTGQTGTGKTTFVCDYVADILPCDVLTLFCSFEMPNRHIFDLFHQQTNRHSAGSSFTNNKDELMHRQTDRLVRRMNNLLLLETDSQSAPQSLPEIFEMLTNMVKTQGIDHLVIDNLQFLINHSSPNSSGSLDRYVQQDNLLGALRRFTNRTRCHVTLVVHPRKELNQLTIQSIGGTPTVTQEADNVLVVQKPSKDASNERQRFLHILKSRQTGLTVTSDRLELVYDRHSRRYSIKDHGKDGFRKDAQSRGNNR